MSKLLIEYGRCFIIIIRAECGRLSKHRIRSVIEKGILGILLAAQQRSAEMKQLEIAFS